MRTINEFGKCLSGAKEKGQHYQTAKGVRTVLNHLRYAINKPSLKFDDLTEGMLIDLKRYLLNRGCCRNTCANYIIRLRAMHRQAAVKGEATDPGCLYGCVLTDRPEPSFKRSVPVALLQEVRDADLSNYPARLGFARDMFILSFHLRGIPFVDLATLRKTDIKEGVLHYCRRKTGKALRVKLTNHAKEIVDRHANTDKQNPYLFSIIKRPNEGSQHTQYESALRLYNKHLKELSGVLLLGDSKLSSYTPRHSWASQAYLLGIELMHISEALSHSDFGSTKRYIGDLPMDHLSRINEKVVGLIEPKQYTRKIDRGEEGRTQQMARDRTRKRKKKVSERSLQKQMKGGRKGW